MLPRLPFAALFALLLLAAAPQARAQTTVEVGPRAGLEINDPEALVLGGDLRVDAATLPFQVQGTFDYYLDSSDAYRFTANGLYEVRYENELFVPYFGPGLSVTRFADDTDVGLNVVGGAEFEVANLGFGAVRPFVQGSFVPLGGEVQPFQVTGGILFELGGGN